MLLAKIHIRTREGSQKDMAAQVFCRRSEGKIQRLTEIARPETGRRDHGVAAKVKLEVFALV